MEIYIVVVAFVENETDTIEDETNSVILATLLTMQQGCEVIEELEESGTEFGPRLQLNVYYLTEEL